MTDAERQQLINSLYTASHDRWSDAGHLCKEAADEIRRLARENNVLKLGAEAWPEILKDRDERLAALAQSDAEPVSWPDIDASVKAGLAWRNPAPDAAPSAHSNTKTVTIGHTAPPRPDASAGLIEAAEWHEEKAKKFRGIKTDSTALITQHHHLAATYFRARAADRSGK